MIRYYSGICFFISLNLFLLSFLFFSSKSLSAQENDRVKEAMMKDKYMRESQKKEKAEKEAQTHDGFFLRMLTGVSLLNLEYAGEKNYDGGYSPYFNFTVGYAISQNFILHGGVDVQRTSLVGSRNDATKTDKITLLNTALGVGFTVYAVPSNVYLTLDVHALNYNTIEGYSTWEGGEKSETTINYKNSFEGNGFGIYFGKEWWVSENWGTGFSIFYRFDKIVAKKLRLTDAQGEEIVGGDESFKSHYNLNTYGIALSTTYN